MARISVLLTGGAGFIGSHIADEIIETTDWDVIVMDRLTYAGRLDRLAHLPKDRLEIIHHDFGLPIPKHILNRMRDVKYIIHNGANSHVVRSFHDPEPFIESNIIGTFNLMEMGRRLDVDRVLLTSTDEVFGPSNGQEFVENDRLRPSNPYSATKAGAEMIANAWRRSYDLPVITTRSMNIIGPKQHCEKYLPMTIRNIMSGQRVKIHTNRNGEIGSRHWLHARTQANAILFLLENGEVGNTYHIGGERMTNLKMAVDVAEILGETLFHEFVNAYDQYPGHDLHYGINDDKIKSLGWTPKLDFKKSLTETVKWYFEHPEWLEL